MARNQTKFMCVEFSLHSLFTTPKNYCKLLDLIEIIGKLLYAINFFFLNKLLCESSTNCIKKFF